MSSPLAEKMKKDVILLSNLMDRLEETTNSYKLSGAVTLSEYKALERALLMYRQEVKTQEGR